VNVSAVTLTDVKRFNWQHIDHQRQVIYRLRPDLRLRTEEEAAQWVDACGFTLLFPVKNIELPNLWEAICGRRRALTSEHYSEGMDETWTWKDTLPARKRIFYAKILRGKATLISLRMLPYFYALSENFGEIDDYLLEYEDGRLTDEAKRVYEALLRHGQPASTGILRREAGLDGKANMTRFDRAVYELQRGFKIAKVGISETNAWKYSYVYDLFIRVFPDVPGLAREITRGQAMRRLVTQYLSTVVVASEQQIGRLFSWEPEATTRLIERMVGKGLIEPVEVEGVPDWLLALNATARR
jgi:hypothetical protein